MTLPPSIPDTLYRVFSSRWIDLNHAPADAADWCRRGYLQILYQGKIPGYAVTQKAYELITDRYGR